jgi:glycosyltransferase involved in cell wall biosynthesis
MEAKPLVSIICVSMNHEKYVEQGITSFVNQTYPNIEFLYLDNCSSDKTFEIAGKVFADFGRPYQAFKRERSYNLPENFNFLIKKAKGDYLVFISVDDWMLELCVEEMLACYQRDKQAGLFYTNGWYYFEDTQTQKLAANKKFISGKIFDHIFLHGPLFPPGIMVKKETFDKVGFFDETLPIEDYDFWLRVAKNTEIGYINKPLIFYRKHLESMTGLYGYCNTKYYLQIVEKYKSNKLYGRVKRNFRKFPIYEHYLNGENKEALSMIWSDFRFEKFYFSVMVKMLVSFLRNSVKAN